MGRDLLLLAFNSKPTTAMIENLPTNKEIKNRISRGQIRLNDDLIDFNKFRELKLDTAVEFGDWLYDRLSNDIDGSVSKCLDMSHILGFKPEVMADTNFPPLQKLFRGKAIITMAKREWYVIDL